MTIVTSTVASRLTRSLLTRLSSSLRAVQLLVDGVELFVGALQLFLGRVELFVGALQFLVAREDLFVGGLQFLVGGLEVLDDRLQIFAAGCQLVCQAGTRASVSRLPGRRASRHLPSAAVGRRRGADRLLEQDQTECRVVRVRERHDLEISTACHSPLLWISTLSSPAPARRLRRAVCSARPQREQQPLARHLQQVQVGIAGGGLEVGAGLAAELDDLSSAVDDDTRRAESAAGGDWLPPGPSAPSAARRRRQDRRRRQAGKPLGREASRQRRVHRHLSDTGATACRSMAKSD